MWFLNQGDFEFPHIVVTSGQLNYLHEGLGLWYKNSRSPGGSSISSCHILWLQMNHSPFQIPEEGI